MPQEVDSLEVKVYANANKANAALDGMITRLSTVATSLGSINSGHLAGMANGVNRLSSAMQGMKDVRVTDFNRLAKGIESLSNLKTSQINKSASALTQLGKAVGSITTNAGSSKQLVELANAISKLGYKSATKALENIPKLSTAMKNLMSEMAKAPKINQSLIDMTNALGRLARTGASSGKAATALGNSLKSYSSTADMARKKSHSLASTIGKMYASYWLVIRAVQKLSSAVEYASKLTEVQNVIDVTFGNAAKKVDEFAATLTGDEKTGAEIIAKALEAPLYAIVDNAGLEGAVVINKVKESEGGIGVDAVHETYVDMMEAGIIDPVKVTKNALANAVSVAATLLTTEAAVADIKEPAPAAQPSPDMY